MAEPPRPAVALAAERPEVLRRRSLPVLCDGSRQPGRSARSAAGPCARRSRRPAPRAWSWSRACSAIAVVELRTAVADHVADHDARRRGRRGPWRTPKFVGIGHAARRGLSGTRATAAPDDRADRDPEPPDRTRLRFVVGDKLSHCGVDLRSRARRRDQPDRARVYGVRLVLERTASARVATPAAVAGRRARSRADAAVRDAHVVLRIDVSDRSKHQCR